MRYFIEFAYNGCHYFGFQIQNNQITIQEVLEEKLSLLLSEQIKITGAGRTDTGVHARQMFAHFNYNNKLPENLIKKINIFLPNDIIVYSIFRVKTTAHARFDAKERTYKYYFSIQENPFNYFFSFPIYHLKLNISEMQEAANYLIKIKNFKSFAKNHSNNITEICNIYTSKFIFKKTKLIFLITADRFLRNMVRSITGGLLEIGKGKLSINKFIDDISKRKRIASGFSLPAKGLFLEKITYPNSIFKKNTIIQ